jgi:hypothetical protein
VVDCCSGILGCGAAEWGRWFERLICRGRRSACSLLGRHFILGTFQTPSEAPANGESRRETSNPSTYSHRARRRLYLLLEIWFDRTQEYAARTLLGRHFIRPAMRHLAAPVRRLSSESRPAAYEPSFSLRLRVPALAGHRQKYDEVLVYGYHGLSVQGVFAYIDAALLLKVDQWPL